MIKKVIDEWFVSFITEKYIPCRINRALLALH